MNGFTIRAFQPADLTPMVAASAQTAWNHLSPDAQVRTTPEAVSRQAWQMVTQALSSPGTICLVGEADGQMAAYELLTLQEDPVSGIPEALKLDGWVAPPYRGQGINQLMHDTAEHVCRQMGIGRMVCVVAAHNGPALRATDRSGFTTERLVRAKWL